MGVLVSPRRHIHDDRDVFYPTCDDEPLAETTLHGDVIRATVTTLRNYLREAVPERSPVVLCDQFVYYAKGFPGLRVAPDLAVWFGVPQIPYENSKIWETEIVLSAPGDDPVYAPIGDGCSEVLGLQLVVEGPSLGRYRLDTGEKLPAPTVLPKALQERERADRLAQELAALRQQLGGNN
ncbi:MAG: Uma2 family endonuclease [Pseudanabaenaceae cyanobacterium]